MGWLVAGILSCTAAAQAAFATGGALPKGDQRPAGAQRHTERHAAQETGDRPPVRREAALCMDEPFHDFGDVQRRGGDLVHDFTIRNEGSAPLVITRVVTSCSCLKAVFSKRPLDPGAEGVIRIVYEPLKSEPGTFHKVIQVYSNSAGGRQVITVQGNSLDPKKM